MLYRLLYPVHRNPHGITGLQACTFGARGRRVISVQICRVRLCGSGSAFDVLAGLYPKHLECIHVSGANLLATSSTSLVPAYDSLGAAIPHHVDNPCAICGHICSRRTSIRIVWNTPKAQSHGERGDEFY